jgi:shikimate dehydrogenase
MIMTPFRFGLVGKDISYTLSPTIFEWAFERTGVAGTYNVFDIAEESVVPLVSGGEWDGLNVTIPYKSAVTRLCDELTDSARDAAAVNTLHRRGEELWGDNTDLSGFGYALARRRGKGESVRNALVIGSGGAARAVVLALSRGYHQLAITVASRNAATARGKLSEFVLSPDIAFCSIIDARETLEEYDLVVNATPAGSYSCPGSPLPLPLKFNPASLVMDLIYDPSRTALLQAAERCGARTENGLVMLIAQAAASFRIWTGREFPLDYALQELVPRFENNDPIPYRR